MAYAYNVNNKLNIRDKNMEKITFNASNWSGEKITIKVYKNNKMSMYDHDFIMEKKEIDSYKNGERSKFDKFISYKLYKLDCDGKKERFPIVSGGCFPDCSETVEMSENDVEDVLLIRSDKNPFVASAKVLANIL